jgi:hypothetical protein
MYKISIMAASEQFDLKLNIVIPDFGNEII